MTVRIPFWFTALLTGSLVLLKVAGIWNLSWFWVFVPIWGPFALFVLLAFVMIISVLGSGDTVRIERKKR